MSREEQLEALIKDLDPRHLHAQLRAVAARCEDGAPSHLLLHDIWEVMTDLIEAANYWDKIK